MQPRICIIKFVFDKAFLTPSLNLEKILEAYSEEIYIINGVSEDIHIENYEFNKVINLVHKKRKSKISRIFGYIYLQLRIALNLIYLSRKVDLCLFFMESGIFLPLLISKILKKRTLWMLPSNFAEMAYLHDDSFSKYILGPLEFFSKKLVDTLILYSPNLVKEWNLEQYKHKIVFAHEHFLDLDTFKNEKPFNQRKNIIGFIGRFSKEKGICEFIKIIELLNKEKYHFLIIGKGPLKDDIKKYCREKKIKNVSTVNWVEHDQLPRYLNEMKLLVIPSYTEGLPNVMLEAMACGTPVLANNVGSIPDIIQDGLNGFITNNNSSINIASQIHEIMNLNLDRVSYNAIYTIKHNFNYEIVKDEWESVIYSRRFKN